MFKKILFSIFLITSLCASDEEALFWAEVKDSNNIELLEAYNQRYPNGVFKIFADMKINKLQASQDNTIMGSRNFLTTGTYRCSNLILTLKDKHIATYTTDGQTYSGIWSSSGTTAIAKFKVDYEYIKFKIKSDYKRYNIYKIPNTNFAYCSATKD